MDPLTNLPQLLANANTFFSSGLYEDALNSYQKALTLDPANSDIQLGVAVSLLKLKRVPEGMAALGKALKLAPEADQPRLRRGSARLLAEAEAFQEAQDILTPVLRGEPTNEDIQLAVRCMAETGAAPDALDLLGRFLPSRPGIWDAVLGDPALRTPARQALLDRQASLVPHIRTRIDAQKKAVVEAQIAYLRLHGDEADKAGVVADWEDVWQTLADTRDLSAAIGARRQMGSLVPRIGQSLLALLHDRYASDTQQLAVLADHARYTADVLPDSPVRASAVALLEQVAAYEQARTKPETAIAAYESMRLLGAQAEEELRHWREELVQYATKHARGLDLLKGRAITQELLKRFPDDAAVQALNAQVGARQDQLKNQALVYLRWGGIVAGALLVVGLSIWGIYTLWQHNTKQVAGQESLPPVIGATRYVLFDQLRVRKAPGESSEVIAGLAEGEAVLWAGEESEPTVQITLRGQRLTGNWKKIRTLQGIEGWVFAGGLGTNRPQGYLYPQARIDDPDGYTNLRQGQSSQSPVIGQVVQGESFEVVDQQSDWWYVRTQDGRSGYMHRSRIRIWHNGQADAPQPTFYIINVDARPTEQEIRGVVEHWRSQGYRVGFLWIPTYPSLSGNRQYAAYIGPYFTQSDCERAVEQYRQRVPGAYGVRVALDRQRVEIRGVGQVVVKNQ